MTGRPATCSKPGCDREVHARGLCDKHYSARRKATRAGPCSIDGCDRLIANKKRQLCEAHYNRYRKYGDPLLTGRPDLGVPLEERFWSKVNKDGPLGCWVWTASLSADGYGQFIVMRGTRGFPVRAHRVAWELLRGPIPDGLVLDHRCRNRACVNPDHLEPVTNEENIERGVWQPVINSRKTHCLRGHEFTEENTYRPPKRPHTRQCRKCMRIRGSKKAA